MKLFWHFILIFTVLLVLISTDKTHARASFSWQQTVGLQDTAKRDSLQRNNKKGPSEIIESFARDSSYYSKDKSTLYYKGNARITFQEFKLDADFISYDSKKHLLFAKGSTDINGKYVNRPIFKMGPENATSADSLLYNTETAKLIVYNAYSEQEGGYFSGGVAKKQPDDELHIWHQNFSTCNLPYPHTHFGIFITKGIATKNLVITGPAYLKVEGVPLPLAIPFGFFPKPNKKASGLIIGTPTEDATRGFMLQNFGYYLAFNDYWDARVMGTITTRGSWDLSLNSSYTKRYKYRGGINLAFASTRLGLEGTPEYKPRKDFSINWSHQQNTNARPGTTFSASVNAQTSTYNTVTAGSYSYDINQIAQNALRSSINYGKVFGDGLFNLNTSIGHSQETLAKTVSLSLPELSLNMSTISPFRNKNNLGDPKWYERLTVGYSLQARNTINTIDSLLFKRESLKKFQNGFQHNIPISLGFNLFKYLNFNANLNYNERWYFQTIHKNYFKAATADKVIIDTISGFKRAGDYVLSLGMSTKLYSEPIKFKNFGKIKALRHVITPSVSISYNPDFTSTKYGIYKNAVYGDGSKVLDPFTNQQVKYSIFEQGVYGGPSSGRSASIGFGIENNVELKVSDKNDTTGNGEKKIPIIQNLSIRGSYNFVAPIKRLSYLSFSGRSQLSDKLGFDFNGTFSPYAVEDITSNGVITRRESDRYTFKDGKLPRLINFGLSFDYSFNPDALKRRNVNMDNVKADAQARGATPEQADQLAMISRDPNAFVDFNLPWNFAFSYSLQYSNSLGNNKQVTNTLNFNGDVNLTPKWKVQFTSGYDFKAKNLSQTSFALYRDLHCWDLSINWVPFGVYKSYSIDLRVRASILQDLKLTKRKAYYTRY